MVRAKFRCTRIVTEDYGGLQQVKYYFMPVSGRDDEYGENAKFHKYTPAGDLWIQVDNPAVKFEVNKSYYLDFTQAAD